MTTETDLANRALSHLSESKISDINDEGSQAARVCKEFVGDNIKEVLRAFRWNCAIGRAVLVEEADAPEWGYERAFALPSDFLRLLEVNGEQYEASQQYFEIEAGNRLLSNWEDCRIRYIKEIGVPAFDPLLAEAISLKLAVSIVVGISGNLNLAQLLEAKYDRTIKKAMFVDAIETGSRENNQIQRAFQGSPLINSRRGGSYRLLNFLHPFRF